MRKSTPLRIPVTNGLKDIYGMDMHSAYQAACVGQFSVVSFSRLASAIAVIRSALEQKQTKIPFAVETLDQAIEALVMVRARGDNTDVWEILESERPAVLAGIDMVEECMGTLDVLLIAQTADQLLTEVLGNQVSST